MSPSRSCSSLGSRWWRSKPSRSRSIALRSEVVSSFMRPLPSLPQAGTKDYRKPRRCSAFFRLGDAGLLKGGLLAAGQDLFIKIIDQLVEQAVPIDARLQVQEHRSQADRGPVHKDKGARRRDATKAADVAMHAVGEVAAVHAASLLLDHPGAVVEQRTVDVSGPAGQHRDHVARQIAKTPAPIGIDGQRLVICFERVVEVDDALYKARRKDADASEIQEVHGAIRSHRVIAEMRIAVDDAVVIKRHVPDPEHAQRDLVAP